MLGGYIGTQIYCLNPYSNGTLSDWLSGVSAFVAFGLNPYSNGTLSDSVMSAEEVGVKVSLNPYSNGTLSDLFRSGYRCRYHRS